MFCINCGSKLPEGARFCSVCGVRVIAAEEPKPAPASKEPETVETPVAAPVVTEAPAPAPEPVLKQTGKPAAEEKKAEPVVREKPVAQPANKSVEAPFRRRLTFDWSNVIDEPQKRTIPELKSPWTSTGSFDEKALYEDMKPSTDRSRTMSFIDILKAEKEQAAAQDSGKEAPEPIVYTEFLDPAYLDEPVTKEAAEEIEADKAAEGAPELYIPPLYDDIDEPVRTPFDEIEEEEAPVDLPEAHISVTGPSESAEELVFHGEEEESEADAYRTYASELEIPSSEEPADVSADVSEAEPEAEAAAVQEEAEAVPAEDKPAAEPWFKSSPLESAAIDQVEPERRRWFDLPDFLKPKETREHAAPEPAETEPEPVVQDEPAAEPDEPADESAYEPAEESAYEPADEVSVAAPAEAAAEEIPEPADEEPAAPEQGSYEVQIDLEPAAPAQADVSDASEESDGYQDDGTTHFDYADDIVHYEEEYLQTSENVPAEAGQASQEEDSIFEEPEFEPAEDPMKSTRDLEAELEEILRGGSGLNGRSADDPKKTKVIDKEEIIYEADLYSNAEDSYLDINTERERDAFPKHGADDFDDASDIAGDDDESDQSDLEDELFAEMEAAPKHTGMTIAAPADKESEIEALKRRLAELLGTDYVEVSPAHEDEETAEPAEETEDDNEPETAPVLSLEDLAQGEDEAEADGGYAEPEQAETAEETEPEDFSAYEDAGLTQYDYSDAAVNCEDEYLSLPEEDAAGEMPAAEESVEEEPAEEVETAEEAVSEAAASAESPEVSGELSDVHETWEAAAETAIEAEPEEEPSDESLPEPSDEQETWEDATETAIEAEPEPSEEAVPAQAAAPAVEDLYLDETGGEVTEAAAATTAYETVEAENSAAVEEALSDEPSIEEAAEEETAEEYIIEEVTTEEFIEEAAEEEAAEEEPEISEPVYIPESAEEIGEEPEKDPAEKSIDDFLAAILNEEAGIPETAETAGETAFMELSDISMPVLEREEAAFIDISEGAAAVSAPAADEASAAETAVSGAAAEMPLVDLTHIIEPYSAEPAAAEPAEADAELEIPAPEPEAEAGEKKSDAVPLEDLEKELFGDLPDNKEDIETTRKINKFYTLYKKNEDFQRLLDEEYNKLKAAGGPAPEQAIPDPQPAEDAAPVRKVEDAAIYQEFNLTEAMSAAGKEAAENAAQEIEEKAEAGGKEAAGALAATATAAAVGAAAAGQTAPEVEYEEVDRGGAFLTVLAVIIAILLVILLAIILILNFAPDSSIALTIDSFIENITSHFTALDAGGEFLL